MQFIFPTLSYKHVTMASYIVFFTKADCLLENETHDTVFNLATKVLHLQVVLKTHVLHFLFCAFHFNMTFIRALLWAQFKTLQNMSQDTERQLLFDQQGKEQLRN
jgi:hypothetical protein